MGRRLIKNYNIEGKKLPNVELKTRVAKGAAYRWKTQATCELFKNKRIVLFALPGAFTPKCTDAHLPGFECKYDEIRNLGIDEIYCLSVNDAFVMHNWAKSLKVSQVKLIPDGSCRFTTAMGACVTKDNLGFGKRSWRYALVVNDCKVEKAFIEKGCVHNCDTDPLKVSTAESIIEYLKSL